MRRREFVGGITMKLPCCEFCKLAKRCLEKKWKRY